MLSFEFPRAESIAAETLIDVVVARRFDVAQDIISLELTTVDGRPLPAFSAGAHIELEVAPGLTRQYSLCNAPNECHRYVLGILREPQSRGASARIHEKFRVGTRCTIRRPRNNFELAKHAKHSVLIAGGIGITPILSMAYHLHAQGASFELHYCARSARRAAFAEEILGSPFSEHVVLHYDDAGHTQRLDIESLVKNAHEEKHLYVCGPSRLLNGVTAAASEAGWRHTNVHSERFANQVELNGGAFEVRTFRSGLTFRVGSEQSIAQVLKSAGLDVPLSCEQGVCGSCLTRVLHGTPEHRDLFLTDEEKAANDRMTICCSRAVSSNLVLDL